MMDEATELSNRLRILWGRRWLISLALVLSASSAYAVSARQAPVYEATAKVFIGPRTIEPGDVSNALEELSFSREFIASYAELLRSRPIAERVVDKEDLPINPADLVRRVETRILPETRIIEVSYQDTDAKRAQTVVDALVGTFVDEELPDFGGRAGIRASVLEPALLPVEPISPKLLRDSLVGAALGVVLGIAVALLLEQLDTTLRSRRDVEDALSPLPVLAAIPRGRGNGKHRKLFFHDDPKSPESESVRILRTNVQFLSIEQPLRRILVTSPYAEDGKTTVAVNLAAGLAAAGTKTVLVETDLRRPVAHEYFGLPISPGLTEVLMGRATVEEAGRPTDVRNLAILPAGTLAPNPAELLGTGKMAGLMEELTENCDTVVLDTPPALAVADATVLAQLTDGVLLVLRAGRTHRQKAKEAKAMFERVGVRVLGVVLNDVDTADAYYYYRYYQGYGAEPKTRRRRRRGSEPDWAFAQDSISSTPFPGDGRSDPTHPSGTAGFAVTYPALQGERREAVTQRFEPGNREESAGLDR
jgi:succinoglycan biosynthesis transport protein ExoP